MVLEEALLILQGSRNLLLVLNVPLATVDHRNVAQSQGDDSAGQNIDDVGSMIHQIHLCQDTDCPLTLRIHLPSKLQTVRIGQILIRCGDGQDDRVRLLDIFQDHLLDLPLDISGLVSHRHLGQTGQIDQSQGQDLGGVDSQVDGFVGNAQITTSLRIGSSDNLISDLVEVVEFFVLNMEELAPLVCVRLVLGVSIDSLLRASWRRPVDKL